MKSESLNVPNKIAALLFILLSLPILIYKPIFVESAESLSFKSILSDLYLFEWDVNVSRKIENTVSIYQFDKTKSEEMYFKMWENLQKNPLAYQDFKINFEAEDNNELNNFLKYFNSRFMQIISERKNYTIEYNEITDIEKKFYLPDMGYIYNIKISEMAKKLTSMKESLIEAQKFQAQIQQNLNPSNQLKPIDNLLESIFSIIELSGDSTQIINHIPVYKPIVYIAMDKITSTEDIDKEDWERFKTILLSIIQNPSEDIYLKNMALKRLSSYAESADQKLTNEVLGLLKEAVEKRRKEFNEMISRKNDGQKLPNKPTVFDPEVTYINSLIDLASKFSKEQKKEVGFEIPIQKNTN